MNFTGFTQSKKRGRGNAGRMGLIRNGKIRQVVNLSPLATPMRKAPREHDILQRVRALRGSQVAFTSARNGANLPTLLRSHDVDRDIATLSRSSTPMDMGFDMFPQSAELDTRTKAAAIASILPVADPAVEAAPVVHAAAIPVLPPTPPPIPVFPPTPPPIPDLVPLPPTPSSSSRTNTDTPSPANSLTTTITDSSRPNTPTTTDSSAPNTPPINPRVIDFSPPPTPPPSADDNPRTPDFSPGLPSDFSLPSPESPDIQPLPISSAVHNDQTHVSQDAISTAATHGADLTTKKSSMMGRLKESFLNRNTRPGSSPRKRAKVHPIISTAIPSAPAAARVSVNRSPGEGRRPPTQLDNLTATDKTHSRTFAALPIININPVYGYKPDNTVARVFEKANNITEARAIAKKSNVKHKSLKILKALATAIEKRAKQRSSNSTMPDQMTLLRNIAGSEEKMLMFKGKNKPPDIIAAQILVDMQFLKTNPSRSTHMRKS
jgi:hypothetical protein